MFFSIKNLFRAQPVPSAVAAQTPASQEQNMEAEVESSAVEKQQQKGESEMSFSSEEKESDMSCTSEEEESVSEESVDQEEVRIENCSEKAKHTLRHKIKTTSPKEKSTMFALFSISFYRFQ